MDMQTPNFAIEIDAFAKARRADRHTVYLVADKDGRDHPLPVWDAPDVDPEALHHCASLVRKALTSVAHLDAARRAVAADVNLSDLGRREKVAKIEAETARAMEQTHSEAAAYAENLKTFRAKTYAPPPIEKTDALAALTDWELRTRLGAMSPEAQNKLLNDLPANATLRNALLRDPLAKGQLYEHAARVHAELVDATSEGARLKAVEDAYAWAGPILANAAKFI